MALRVNEIFYSIQGESSYAWLPCVFIRLTGCNLRCNYCDTRYAYDDGDPFEISSILEKVETYHCPLVEITGGEPLIQKETPDLVLELLDQGYEVLIETNGSQDISLVDDRCTRIVDIKCPSSCEQQENDLDNLSRLTSRDEVKFVIGDRTDFDFSKTLLQQYPSVLEGKNPVHFSPAFGQLHPERLANWILDAHLNVRLHLQMHKLIWDADARGV